VAADLEIINTVSMETQGRTHTGKQGDYDDTAATPKTISLGGQIHSMIGSLATATGVTVWDDDDDAPTDWDYLYFWADQDCYIQLIGASTNVSLPIKAGVPFTLYGDDVLAAANTTPLAAAPSLEAIDSVRIWNQSGNTMNFDFKVFD
jgi:hypothetical protein